jgi:hypothetical protein
MLPNPFQFAAVSYTPVPTCAVTQEENLLQLVFKEME